ncbi:hypothetical protein NEOLEDRAFT_1239451 [Neolentinus lepideus HHB14362 ss-1]|uniref:Alpha-ketoglutarate-dependent dioxygenase AlkB-like domain-containing protein n=1 Tax=Neolentinus lepideus HHB14362 ss-1 TaxID=1314782 RepID=A0A165UPE8_9AGAM|nr:hypothetical protein NEOLEDRAFT_1239451 [Neolentinus lepideus HHB14362 ss-1]
MNLCRLKAATVVTRAGARRTSSGIGTLKRCASSTFASFVHGRLPPEFTFLPYYFSLPEQCLLLRAALMKLDSVDRRQARRHRKSLPPPIVCDSPTTAADIFLPDQYYLFEQGHYDGVIRNYRETHITTWPESEIEGLTPVIKRLYDMAPTKNVQTHILHLATDGEIIPHVDNVTASGTWILGVSLGAERVLRLESLDGTDFFEVLLPSGSLYIQRDDTRYNYQHSILMDRGTRGRQVQGGQRISIMIRDLFQPSQ